MVETRGFLEKTKKLIGDSDADLKAIQDTLEALRKVSPDLVDSKIWERLSRLVDSARIAKNTQAKVSQLNRVILDQQKRLVGLTEQTNLLKKGFDKLHDQLVRGDMADRRTRQKTMFVLDELEQYLRRHS